MMRSPYVANLKLEERLRCRKADPFEPVCALRFFAFVSGCLLAVWRVRNCVLQRGGCLRVVRVGHDPDSHRLQGLLEATHRRQQGINASYTFDIRTYVGSNDSVRKCNDRLGTNVDTLMIIIFPDRVVCGYPNDPYISGQGGITEKKCKISVRTRYYSTKAISWFRRLLTTYSIREQDQDANRYASANKEKNILRFHGPLLNSNRYIGQSVFFGEGNLMVSPSTIKY